MKHGSETQYLTTAAVARRLGVSRSTVLRAVRREEIRPALHTPGGALRFSSFDVETFVAKLSAQPTIDSSPASQGALPAAGVRELDRLHRILDHLPAAIAYWDADLRNVFANQAHVEWFGMTPDQMRGRHVREVLGEDLYSLARPYLEAALGGIAQSYDRVSGDAQSGLRAVQAAYIPDIDQGTTRGLFAMVSDITARTRAEEERERLAAIVSEAGDAMLSGTIAGVIMSWNRGAERLFGYTSAEAVGQPFALLVPSDRRHEISELLEPITRGEHISQYETERLCKNGKRVAVSMTLAPIRNGIGIIVGTSMVARDITERKRVESALRTAAETLRHLVNVAPISMAILSSKGIYEEVNEAYCALCGYSREELVGQSVTLLFPPEQRDNIAGAFAQRVRGEVDGQHEWNVVTKDGTRRTVMGSGVLMPAPDGLPRRVSFLVDITERKKTEQHFFELAHFDRLTGLPNRTLFSTQLRQALDAANQSDEKVALLFIDLDGFKSVNDTLGHDAGDSVLRFVAKRLLHCLREGDTVCRLAGDEFACILPNIKSAANAERVAGKVVAALDEPVRIDDHRVTTYASVGFSLYPQDGMDESTLLARADAAMYAVKRDGKDRRRSALATLPESDRSPIL